MEKKSWDGRERRKSPRDGENFTEVQIRGAANRTARDHEEDPDAAEFTEGEKMREAVREELNDAGAFGWCD